MPKPPLIESPRLRTAAINVAMTLLLAISLLLAYAFSNSSANLNTARRNIAPYYSIGEWRLPIPPGWEVSPKANSLAARGAQLNLVNRNDVQSSLSYGFLQGRPMRSPALAMEEATRNLIGDKASQLLHETIVHDNTKSGLLRILLVKDASPDAGDAATSVHHLMVFSTDARDYVVIHHVQMTQPDEVYMPDTVEFQRSPTKLLMQYAVAAAINTTYRVAKVDDLVASGICSPAAGPQLMQQKDDIYTPVNIDPDGKWVLMSYEDQLQGSQLHLFPLSTGEGFWTAQIIGAIDPAQADPKLDGASLLALAAGEQKEPNNPFQKIVSTFHIEFKGWKMIFNNVSAGSTPVKTGASPMPAPVTAGPEGEQPEQVDGLARELWYVPVGGNRVIIAQLIGEPKAMNGANRQLTQVIVNLKREAQNIHQLTNSGSATPGMEQDTWQQAVERGSKLAQTARAHAQSSAQNGMTYSLVGVNDRVIGFVINELAKGEESLPLRGRTLFVLSATPQIVIKAAWSSNADTSRFWYTEQVYEDTITPAQDTSSENKAATVSTMLQKTSAMRLELKDGVLTKVKQDESSMGNATTWHYNTADNYVSDIMLNYLSLEDMQRWSTQPPAAIMYSMNGEMPEPCWLEIRAVRDKWRMTIRSLAHVSGDMQWFDQLGKNIHYSWLHTYPAYGAPMRFSVNLSERDTVTKVFESLKPQITEWEKESKPDETASE